MNTLIVYYSMSGNTRLAAERIAGMLPAGLLELRPVKNYPDRGFRKFFVGGGSAVMGEHPELVPYAFDAAAWDRIIFAFPVWAGRVTPPLRTFIRDHAEALKGKRIAAVACQSGSGARRAFAALCSALGINSLEAELVLIDPAAKPDPVNDDRLRAFCDRLGGD